MLGASVRAGQKKPGEYAPSPKILRAEPRAGNGEISPHIAYSECLFRALQDLKERKIIVYQLACGQGHFFEGWFASAEACDKQAEAGQLQCPTCARADVRKLPSAPHVHTSGGDAAPAQPPAEAQVKREALLALRKFILSNTENVGRKFAEVARRIHYQQEEARGIRGRVTPEEAEELRDEGVPAYAVAAEVIPSEEVH